MSTILLEIQLNLSAYSNHLTIQPPLLYYRRHNYTHLPTATTLQNNHFSIILPVTQFYSLAYTCLPYFQRPAYSKPPYNSKHLSTILAEIQLNSPAYSNHLTITTTCLPYFQRYKLTNLPSATTLQLQPLVDHTTRHNCSYLPTSITLQ